MPRSKKIRPDSKNNACYSRTIKNNGKWRGKTPSKYVKYKTVKKKYDEPVLNNISATEQAKIYKKYKDKK